MGLRMEPRNKVLLTSYKLSNFHKNHTEPSETILLQFACKFLLRVLIIKSPLSVWGLRPMSNTTMLP